MVILAAAIIISLENTGIIGAAENAVCKTNIKQAQNLAVLTWSNIYTKPDEYTMDNIEEKLQEEFEKNGLKYEDYNIEVTKNGINVSSKAGCTDSSGVEGGSGNVGTDEIPTNWEYAYTYNREADTWTAITTNDGTQLTGDIAIRMYKNGTYDIDGVVVDTYDTIVSGTGEVNLYEMNDEDVIKLGGEVGNEDNYTSLVHTLTINLEIKEGITSIGENGFHGEANYDNYGLLKSVKLPNSLITIGDEAFYGQYGLEEIEFGTGVEEIGQQAFMGCVNIETLDIPDTVTIIGTGAFEYCTSLKEITIPKNVTTLYNNDRGREYGAFKDCTALTKVNILGKLTSWLYAFSGCTALKDVTLVEGITMIDKSSFEGCSSLVSIVLPSSVTEIKQYAFEDCSALETINFAGTQEQWNAITGLDYIPSTVTIEYNHTGN